MNPNGNFIEGKWMNMMNKMMMMMMVMMVMLMMLVVVMMMMMMMMMMICIYLDPQLVLRFTSHPHLSAIWRNQRKF